MIKRNKLICAFAAIGGTAVLSAGIFSAPTPASAAEWNDIALQAEYSYGEKLNVPARTLSAGGQTAKASSVLSYPDGSSTLKTETTLDMTGVYTLAYTAEIGGRIYKTEESFRVYDDMARVGEGSCVSYGRHPLSSRDGLSVSLAQGDTLRFSPLIDLNASTKDDPIVEMFVTPKKQGTLDFEKIVFTLTDAENPDCFLKISGRQSSDGIRYPYTYFLAGGNGQPMEGWEQSHNKLHVDNEWGSPAEHSFYGYYPERPSASLDETRISIRYDAETRSVYAGNNFVIDLDSSKYYTKLWDGFTSGKVRLSVSADVYSAATADFVVTYVKDVDLAAEKLVDSAAPEISLNMPYETAPVAKVGLTYPVPAASAKDEYSGDCEVEVGVWYDFSSENALTVPIEDGKFKAEREGKYAVVYKSCDRQGNEAKRIVWVDAKKDVPAVSLDVPEAGRVTEASAGEFVPLAEATATGGSGDVKIYVRAIFDSEEIFVEKEGFRPQEAGTYTIEYSAVDYIGQTAKKSYTLTVKNGNVPIFAEAPVLPLYYISGSEYAAPKVYAYDYSSGTPEKVEAKLTVTDANGTREAGERFTPAVLKSGDEVTLVFRAGKAELVKKIKAIRPYEADGERMRLKLENYLVSDDASYAKYDDCIRVSAGSADTSWTFAHELLAEGFSMELRSLPDKAFFDGLKIVLADSGDPSVSITIELLYTGKKTQARIGGTTMDLESSVHVSAANKNFEIGYGAGRVKIGTASIAVAENGFTDFPSGFAYLSVAFTGAREGAAYEITNINDQPVSNTSTDRIKPKIVLFGSYGGTAAVGSPVTVPKGLAGDVLDPEVTFSVSVTDPAGKAVTSSDGILLENVSPDREYVFTAEEYGQYQINYTAEDTFNAKPYTFGYAVTVEDREPPAVEFKSEFPAEIRKGEVIVIPDFTVSDNVTATENLVVNKYILTSGGVLVPLSSDSNSFRPTKEGVYQIRIVVTDEAGNVTLIRRNVTVTA